VKKGEGDGKLFLLCNDFMVNSFIPVISLKPPSGE
jgi:hypothetical protein